MDPKLQRRIQRYGWDKAAERYEAGWQSALQPAQDRLLASVAAGAGEHILDVACGTGLVTFPLAEQVGPTGRVLATDISQNMVNEVERLAGERKMPWVETRRLDAEHLDGLVDDHFDVGVWALGMMYVPGPMKAFSEILRVLKPGGRFVLSVWGERRNCGWADIFPIVDAEVKSEVCPMFFRLGTSEMMALELKATGFDILLSERIETELHYSSGEEAIDAAFLGGPVALAYSRFDQETKARVNASYLSSIDQFRVESQYRITGEFVVVSCRKPIHAQARL